MMARLRLARPKVRPAGHRLKAADLGNAVRDPDRVERMALYQTTRWKALRKDHLKQEPRCRLCGAWGVHVDHLLGHQDDQARAAAGLLGLGDLAADDWQTRFWRGPFVSLCDSHHSSKTVAEMRGKLMDWIAAKLIRARHG